MSKTFSVMMDLPVDVETCWRTLTGAAWPQALDAHLHDGSRLVSADATDDGGAVVAISRRLPEGVPGPLKRFLPVDGRITQTDTWGPARDGARHGTWAASFPGGPGTVAGETSLEPVPGGTRWTVRGTISLKIPLVGGKFESYVAPLLEQLVSRQGRVLHDELS